MLAFCAALWYNFRQEGGQVVALCLGSRSGVAWELVPRSAGSGLLSQAHRVMHSMSLTISLSVQPNAFKYWISLLSSLAVISFISFHLPLRISRPGGAFDFFGKPRSGTGVPFSGASRDESVSAPLFGCSTSDRLANPNVQAGRNSQRRREKKFSYKPRIMPRNFSGL